MPDLTFFSSPPLCRMMKWFCSVLQPSTKSSRSCVWPQKGLATDFASWSPLRIPRWGTAFSGYSNIRVLVGALKLFMGTLLFSMEQKLKEIEQSFPYSLSRVSVEPLLFANNSDAIVNRNSQSPCPVLFIYSRGKVNNVSKWYNFRTHKGCEEKQSSNRVESDKARTHPFTKGV